MTGGNGVYAVSYTIKPGDPVGKRRVGVRVTKGNGQAETAYAAASLTIAEVKAKDLAITTPNDRSKVGFSVTVGGVAAANAQVRVTITGNTISITKLQETEQVAQVTVKTGADGLWTTGAIDLPNEKKYRAFTITAELLDDKGNVTKKATIRLTR